MDFFRPILQGVAIMIAGAIIMTAPFAIADINRLNKDVQLLETNYIVILTKLSVIEGYMKGKKDGQQESE